MGGACPYPVPVTYLWIFLAAAGGASAYFLSTRLLQLSESLMVMNFRGRRIPAIGGVVLVLSILLCAAILAFLAWAATTGAAPFRGSGGRDLHRQFPILVLAVGFFSLGLIDDLSDGSRARGLRGHLGALKKGTITGGLIKAAGGLMLAFSVTAVWSSGWMMPVLDAVLIAASANLFNLLDLRPGRACKFYLLAWIPLAIAGAGAGYLPISAGLAGAAAGWLPVDLGEKGTLGDSGSNMLGGVLGAGIVSAAPSSLRILLMFLFLALTLASERFSFTEAISGFSPLRWFDRWGRAPE